MNTASSLDGCSSVWWSQMLHVYWPWSWCGFQTDLTAACWRCRKISAQKQNFSRLKAMLKSCAAACEDSCAILARRSLEYGTSSKKGLFPLLILVLWVCPHTWTFTTGLTLFPDSWRASMIRTRIWEKKKNKKQISCRNTSERTNTHR